MKPERFLIDLLLLNETLIKSLYHFQKRHLFKNQIEILFVLQLENCPFSLEGSVFFQYTTHTHGHNWWLECSPWCKFRFPRIPETSKVESATAQWEFDIWMEKIKMPMVHSSGAINRHNDYDKNKFGQISQKLLLLSSQGSQICDRRLW